MLWSGFVLRAVALFLVPVLGGSVTIARVSGSSSVPVVDPAASRLSSEENADSAPVSCKS